MWAQRKSLFRFFFFVIPCSGVGGAGWLVFLKLQTLSCSICVGFAWIYVWFFASGLYWSCHIHVCSLSGHCTRYPCRWTQYSTKCSSYEVNAILFHAKSKIHFVISLFTHDDRKWFTLSISTFDSRHFENIHKNWWLQHVCVCVCVVAVRRK